MSSEYQGLQDSCLRLLASVYLVRSITHIFQEAVTSLMGVTVEALHLRG